LGQAVEAHSPAILGIQRFLHFQGVVLMIETRR
jgi:hypothetical protein